MIPLPCPFCPDFIAVNDNAEGLLFFKQHIIDRHLLTEIVDKLGDMIAKQSGNKEGLEQKIKDIITKIESSDVYYEDDRTMTELRKLIE